MPHNARSAAVRTTLLALALGASCAPGPEAEEDPAADGGDRDVDAGPDADCAAVGPGIALNETAAFQAGDTPVARVVLMGGGSEVDRASALFVDAAGGGDVLVLRASGSIDSYTSYFSAELPLTTPPRAVATARLDVGSAGSDPGLLCRVARADAIWLAGGDQGDYLLRWPDALHTALQDAVARGVAIGGTSAGAMSLSQFAYDARDGGASSAEALSNPSAYSVLPSPFAAVPGVVVDTHFQQRDREGRLLAFVAKANQGAGGVLGVGLDEGTALVLEGDSAQVLADDGGRAHVYRADTATVTAGAPLQLTGVAVSLADGATTTMPPAFAGASPVVVEDGVVVAGAVP